MTALTLHPHEVRAFLAGRLGVIVRPLRAVDQSTEAFPNGILDCFDPPIPRGPFWGRETWARNTHGYAVKYGLLPECLYRADSDADYPWRSPATMPRAHSRISGTVGDSRVCRLGEVTGAEVFAWGRYNGFLTDPKLGFPRAQGDLRDFWQATYRDYDANPWVQVARIERSAS